jgi:CheY-like chemotaxis protein
MSKPLVNIVLADDDLEDLEMLEYVFKRKNPEVNIHTFTNGNKLIDYLKGLDKTHSPCLIILDYNMPELTGAEVLAKLANLNLYQSVPKIILSTSSTSSYIHECKINGATDYFVKPNTLQELEALAYKMLKYCN